MKTAVRFLRKCPPYNSGDVAGFEGRELEGLLASGAVGLVDQPKAKDPETSPEVEPPQLETEQPEAKQPKQRRPRSGK